MAVNGQLTDKGQSMSTRDRGTRHNVNFVEGSPHRKHRPELSKALNGHAVSSSGSSAQGYANSSAGNTSRKASSGQHGPNIQRGGVAMPHADVQTARGSVPGKTTRQGRNTYGPNIQFQGAGHKHDGVKTSGS